MHYSETFIWLLLLSAICVVTVFGEDSRRWSNHTILLLYAILLICSSNWPQTTTGHDPNPWQFQQTTLIPTTRNNTCSLKAPIHHYLSPSLNHHIPSHTKDGDMHQKQSKSKQTPLVLDWISLTDSLAKIPLSSLYSSMYGTVVVKLACGRIYCINHAINSNFALVLPKAPS